MSNIMHRQFYGHAFYDIARQPTAGISSVRTVTSVRIFPYRVALGIGAAVLISQAAQSCVSVTCTRFQSEGLRSRIQPIAHSFRLSFARLLHVAQLSQPGHVQKKNTIIDPRLFVNDLKTASPSVHDFSLCLQLNVPAESFVQFTVFDHCRTTSILCVCTLYLFAYAVYRRT